MENMKLITQDEIKKVLDMKTAMEAVNMVYAEQGSGRVLMPAKITLDTGETNDWPPYGGSYNAMPAYVGGDVDVSGIKWVWGFNDNRAKGLPYIGGIIILNEPRTGEVLAVMDGSYITDVRTGASAGVAAKYLARKGASVAAVIGAGAQGRMVARALKEACALKELHIADLYPEAAGKYAREMGEELGLKILPCQNNEEACTGADIIVTCTTAHAVLVRREWVKNGCTVISLGSFPELDERIPEECDMLVVDNWAQNSHRGELKTLVHDGKITDSDIYGELPEIAAGKKPGRQSDDQIICACIIGMGSTDIGTAGLLYRKVFAKDDSVLTYSLRKSWNK